MLRYWYKLNGDTLNYGIGNEKLTGGTYNSIYPKLLYENALNLNESTRPGNIDLSSFGGRISISFWVYVARIDAPDPTQGFGPILTIFSPSNNLLIAYNSYHLMYQFGIVRSNGGTTNIIPNTSYNYKWTHFVISYTSEGIKIYTNGEGVPINLTVDSFTHLEFNSSTLEGCLSDLKIYDHVLSQKEIEELSKGLLVHIPFNDLSVPSVTLSNYIPGQGYVNYTSTLTKDSSVLTGSLPNVPKEWIMQHLGETICASAYVYSLGSYTAGTALGRFGIHYSLRYINTNNVEKAVDPLLMFTPGLNGLYYSTWTIPSDIKSCTTDLIMNNHTLGVQLNAKYGATPDQYGVTWTFSHFKIELGNYPTNPFRNYSRFLDISGHNYYGDTQNCDVVRSIIDSPRYKTGIRLNGELGDGADSIVHLYGLYYEYGTFLLDKFTISFWFKPYRKLGTNWTLLLGCYNNGNGIIFSCNPGLQNGFYYSVYYNNNTYHCSLNKLCLINKWYHYVVTYDSSLSSKISIYIDGQLEMFSGTISNYLTELPDTPIVINRSRTGDIGISDFRIYKTVLSELQIKDLYNESAVIDNNGNILTYELNEL